MRVRFKVVDRIMKRFVQIVRWDDNFCKGILVLIKNVLMRIPMRCVVAGQTAQSSPRFSQQHHRKSSHTAVHSLAGRIRAIDHGLILRRGPSAAHGDEPERALA